MIKVIKHGRPVRYQVTCPSCDCEFTYDKSDLDSLKDVTCPDCHTKVRHCEVNIVLGDENNEV